MLPLSNITQKYWVLLYLWIVHFYLRNNVLGEENELSDSFIYDVHHENFDGRYRRDVNESFVLSNNTDLDIHDSNITLTNSSVNDATTYSTSTSTTSTSTPTTITTTQAEVQKSSSTTPSNSFLTSSSVCDPEKDDDCEEIDIDGVKSKTQVDHHRYYKSFYKRGKDDAGKYWVDLDSLPSEKVVAHESLSSAHRRALTVSLTFDFPFYGHSLSNVTIATGGFLFTGSFLHKWLAATQYIAPLMANFDTSVSSDAQVKYADNGTALIVQWEKVLLQDDPQSGPFTFQVIIHKSGYIVFAYKDIPVVVTVIGDVEHPVKVGLSDAYIVEKVVFYVRKKTIYEYHKIDLKQDMVISNWTAIVFEPLPLCVAQKDCFSCLKTINENFKCEWCQRARLCSSKGVDRLRQLWLDGHCTRVSETDENACDRLALEEPYRASKLDSEIEKSASINHHAVIAIVLTISFVICIAGWIFYAYMHPHSASGQILIKYRPRAWSWRRGEARYTAATMHSTHM